MPKRFTDTEKWKKPFVRALQAPYKLLWFYILDECDASGMWQVDFEVAQIKIGEKLNEADAKRFFAEKIMVLGGGSKWFIPAFIEFQYGTLSENNRAHTKVIATLKKMSLLDENLKVIEEEIKTLTRPLQGAKEKEQEQEEEEVEEEEKEKEAKRKKPPAPKQIPVMFREDPAFDYESFERAFDGTDYALLNLKYYYESVLNWSDSKGSKKLDWIATARNFMLSDVKEGKAVTKNQNLVNNGSAKQGFKNGQQPTGGNVNLQSAFDTLDRYYSQSVPDRK